MKKKVLFILWNQKFFGGVERRLLRVYNELSKSCTVEIVVRNGNRKDFDSCLSKSDVNIDNISMIHFCSNIKALFLIVYNKYDVIHFFDYCNFNYVSSIICNLIGTKVICTIAYQNYALGIISKEKIVRLKKLFSHTDVIDCLFHNGQNFLSSITKSVISFTPGTFTDTNLFYPKQKDKIMVFGAARLESDKNAKLLLEALILCQDEIRKNGYRILILGKGFEEEQIRKFLSDNALNDFVDMLGYVKTSSVLPRASVFFTLNKIENYPSQIWAEAISSGCYIIATNVGETKIDCNNKFTSLISSNPKELAKVIVNYINFPQPIKEQYAIEAREYALKHKHISKTVEYFLEIIQKS